MTQQMTQRAKLYSFPAPMQQLGQVVLDAKKDIKFHRGAENRIGAAKFARQHNLTLGPVEDINGDGVNDVVLYDKNGNPVLINGYGVTPSKLPYREVFDIRYPKRSDKARIGGYSGFMNKLRRNEIEDLDYKKFVQSIKPGYAKLSSLKDREPTRYNTIIGKIRKALSNGIEDYLRGIDALRTYSWIVSRFPYMKACSVIYNDTIYKPLWNDQRFAGLKQNIMATTTDSRARFELFKREIKKKDYKAWVDDILNSQQVVDDIDKLDGSPYIENFVTNIAHLPDFIQQGSLPTDEEMNERDGKIKATVFKEDMNEILTETDYALINDVFRI